jgi:hypothetical protein
MKIIGIEKTKTTIFESEHYTAHLFIRKYVNLHQMK